MGTRRPCLLALVLVFSLPGCSRKKEDLAAIRAMDRDLTAGRHDEVIRRCREHLERYPRSFRGWNLMGWAFAKKDHLEEAERCFDMALECNARWDNAYIGKGVIHRKRGDLDKAKECYLKAISLVPDNAEAYASLLVIELLEGNDLKAVEYEEKAWALRQDLPTIPSNLAVAYHYLGDEKKRDEFYENARRLGYPDLQALQDIFSGKTSIR